MGTALLIVGCVLFAGIGIMICCAAIGGAKLAKQKIAEDDEYYTNIWKGDAK